VNADSFENSPSTSAAEALGYFHQNLEEVSS
jgi:hypothetical protein